MLASNSNEVVDFGEEDNSNRSFKHPYCVVFHLAFRCLALAIYIFAGFISNSFIICFLLILFFLTLDFWTVKNISGRLLVGLRWWNFVDDEGNSHWRFESRKDESGVSAAESRVFWTALVVTPFVWAAAALLALFTLHMSWLIVTIMGVSMTGSNLYGYLRCKWSSRQELSAYLSQTLFSSFLSRAAKETVTGSNRPSTGP